MKSTIQLFIFLHAATSATGFSAPTTSSPPWQGFLDALLPSAGASAGNSQRQQLKQQLIDECRANIGKNTPAIRSRIESIMDDLAPLNPTQQPATSPMLQRKWILEWTSEKEINFFLEKGISDEIIQTLGGGVLENDIPFVKGGSFGVTGAISADEERELRTNFKFQNANLDLGRWGSYNFPPVGEGWFDTIYLDEGLRIDTNSRDDILICRAE